MNTKFLRFAAAEWKNLFKLSELTLKKGVYSELTWKKGEHSELTSKKGERVERGEQGSGTAPTTKKAEFDLQNRVFPSCKGRQRSGPAVQKRIFVYENRLPVSTGFGLARLLVRRSFRVMPRVMILVWFLPRVLLREF